VYRGSRTLQRTKTFYNEIIALVDEHHRVRTTQLFEDGVYTLVTMIDETKANNGAYAD
jgi:catechol-2,3-dioxygenase